MAHAKGAGRHVAKAVGYQEPVPGFHAQRLTAMTALTEDASGVHESHTPLLGPPVERVAPFKARLNLTWELAVVSFKLKYAGSILGYVWSLVKPLLLFGMLYLIFAKFLLRNQITPQENFPAELLVGIVVWTFFSEATTSAVASVVQNADMVNKTSFPRWILVLSATLTALMTMAINMALVVVVAVIFGWFHAQLSVLLVIPLVLELYLLALGLGFGLAAAYVKFRDVQHVWDLLLQLLFYASGIIFPLSLLSAGAVRLMMLNPVAQVVEDVRRALVTRAIPWSADVLGWHLLIPLGLVAFVVAAGVLVFRGMSKRFAENL